MPLIIGGKQSRVRVGQCRRWAQAAAAPNVRVLWIPALDTYIGHVATVGEQRSIVATLLSYFASAQLFPPLAWDDLFEHKDRVYAAFGPQFMLPSLWVPISSTAEIDKVAALLLQDRADGKYMLKGSYSYGGRTANCIIVEHGRCSNLRTILLSLFDEYHQRCVGIQPYEPSLRLFELRVFLVQDAGAPGGWRQCVSVATKMVGDLTGLRHDPNGHSFSVEQRQPTNGRPLLIAGFIDTLLSKHAGAFAKATSLHMPLLRLDCSYSYSSNRCFLNELCCAGDACLFTQVHSQDLAIVVATGFVQQMWAMLQ